MRKIKIALLMYSMDCGGIEKAAISILRTLPDNDYDIHLIVNKKQGAFLKYIPSNIKIRELEVSDIYTKRTTLGEKKWLLYNISKGNFKLFFSTAWSIAKSLFLGFEKKKLYKVSQLAKAIKFPTDSFDFVLAYSNTEQLYYAVNHYDTRHIITWLHREVDLKREDYRIYTPLYAKCTRIFGVSQKVVDSFKYHLPEFANRTFAYLNLIDAKLGIEMANRYTVDRPHKKWWLLTVARLTRQKGIDIIPEIALKLKESGIDFAWSIIGNGPMQTLLKEKAKKYGIEDELLIEGEIDNPYPYFKDCDIYLQPSRYEGYCITVAEARMFCKPIVATDFAGASEQLEDGKCGKIVRFGIDSFADGIIEVINNPELRKRYKDGLAKQKIDTTDTISVLTDFFKSTLKNQDENK